jgi:type II secretory pathway component PulF
MSNLMYPVFLIHAAAIIIPFPQLFLSGNLFAYLGQVLGVLLPIYAVVFFLIYAAQSRHGEKWRAVVEEVCRPIPFLGQARQDLALARLTVALEALVNAGVNIIEAWELAVMASGSPRLRRAVTAWRPRLETGQTPAEAIEDSGVFPDLFANMYRTGEISGQLDQTLKRLHGLYQDSASRKLRLLAEWTPRLVYLAIALLIAWQIISFWLGYFNQIGQVLQ